MSAEAIARALRLRRSGREFGGRCPSCGYKSGFTLAERDGSILVCCHAGGCSQAELWAALEQAGIAIRGSGGGSVRRSRHISRRESSSHPSERFSTPINRAAGNQSGSEAAALAIWRRSRPARGTAVETYLREARGYTGPIPAALRFAYGKHRSDPERWHPMMVASVLFDGRIAAVHRTFLRPDGSGKANLDPNKMTLGPCKGAAVPLAPAGPVIAVAEGIESALGYMQAARTPTWAGVSAGGIRNLILPDTVRDVVIAADPDPVGIMAAHAAARRWLREGRRVSIARPPLGHDFNDLARAS